MKKRVLSAIVLLSITLPCILLSEYSRTILFAVAACLCAYEWAHEFGRKGIACAAWVMYLFVASEVALVLLHVDGASHQILFIGCIYCCLITGIFLKDVSSRGALCTAAGLAYPCALFAAVMKIGVVSEIWFETLTLACLSTWVCDSFAMFGGQRFGKHAVAPQISPNKTVEGCLWGAASSLVTGLIIYCVKLLPDVSLAVCVLTAFVASTMGQIGDLAESSVKRLLVIKDFSNLIPGHGGMMDRADSLLFSIPTAYLCLTIFGLA